eukprot:4401136-Pyramimonas_sp.AAC.1
MINVPETVFWKDSGLCGCNSYVDSVFKPPTWRSGITPDRQDAAVRLIRGVEIPKTMFWHA